MKTSVSSNRQWKAKRVIKIPGLWLIDSSGAVKIVQENILYCHHAKGITRIYFACGNLAKVNIPLKRLEIRLCRKRFYRCHRNYIVNLNYAGTELQEDDTVLISSSKPVPVSRRKRYRFGLVMERLESFREVSA